MCNAPDYTKMVIQMAHSHYHLLSCLGSLFVWWRIFDKFAIYANAPQCTSQKKVDRKRIGSIRIIRHVHGVRPKQQKEKDKEREEKNYWKIWLRSSISWWKCIFYAFLVEYSSTDRACSPSFQTSFWLQHFSRRSLDRAPIDDDEKWWHKIKCIANNTHNGWFW